MPNALPQGDGWFPVLNPDHRMVPKEFLALLNDWDRRFQGALPFPQWKRTDVIEPVGMRLGAILITTQQPTLLEHSVYIRHSAKHFISLFYLILPTIHILLHLTVKIQKVREVWLAKVSQLVSGRARTQTQVFLTPKSAILTELLNLVPSSALAQRALSKCFTKKTETPNILKALPAFKTK